MHARVSVHVTNVTGATAGCRGQQLTGRTCFNLLIKSQLLCQLSYAPGTRFARRKSPIFKNLRRAEPFASKRADGPQSEKESL